MESEGEWRIFPAALAALPIVGLTPSDGRADLPSRYGRKVPRQTQRGPGTEGYNQWVSLGPWSPGYVAHYETNAMRTSPT
jgi:hypothetical protein